MARSVLPIVLYATGALAFSPIRAPLSRGKVSLGVASLDSVAENRISEENPLHIVIAGAGVGGLCLANAVAKYPHIKTTVLEKTSKFKRFGGPIQLASNAMQTLKEMDGDMYKSIDDKATYTGNLKNGIKDGIRDEW